MQRSDRQASPAGLARILVTGASGFVGSALCDALAQRGHSVRGAFRHGPTVASHEASVEPIPIGAISGESDWTAALAGAGTVVHLAALTHTASAGDAGELQRYRAINVDATLRLARSAAAAGARRLVFMSSVKVNGERTREHPYKEIDSPQPEDAYGISKWEAEQALARVSREEGLEVVVLRAPLVYGPGVKANFLRLMRWIDRGVPLPLASIDNLRSLVYLGNLVDAIIACLESPAAAGNTYLVSDGEDLSTPELVRRLAAALEVPAKLLPCPPALLKLGGALTGKSAEVARLTGSLQVDSSRIRRELGWQPPFSLDEGLRATARWYKDKALRRGTPPPSRPSP